MKRRSQLLLVTLATLALVFAYGCSDDDTGGSSGNNGGANTGMNNTMTGGNNPNNTMENNANNTGNNVGMNNQGNNANNTMENNANNTMQNNAMEGPYNFSAPASYINSIALETDGSVGADVNGDGSPDNALGSLLSQLGGLLGDTDLNAQLQDSIDSGSLSIGMVWPNSTDASDATDTGIDFMVLSSVNPLPDTSEFTADPSSFEDGTETPRIRFMNGTIAGGSVTAGPGRFEITVPLTDEISLDLLADKATITGDVSGDASGMAMANGTLSGAVPLTSIIDALNAFLASPNCDCLQFDAPLIDTTNGIGPQSCGEVDTSTCEEGDTCATIANLCTVAVPILAGQPDIDLDGDGSPDAISIYIYLAAEGTNISGITAE